MNILLVDDHPMVLHSLSGLLKSQGHQLATADGCQRAREVLLGGEAFDLLLLDYHLPDGSALDLLRELPERLPQYVVIISGISDVEETLYILEKTAAKAFVPKNIDLEDLVAALEQVVTLPAGESRWVWQPKARMFADTASAYSKETTLSPKEREVFMLLRQGLQDKQIADRINRSIHTVRVQIRAIRRKRGVSRRAEVDL